MNYGRQIGRYRAGYQYARDANRLAWTGDRRQADQDRLGQLGAETATAVMKTLIMHGPKYAAGIYAHARTRGRDGGMGIVSAPNGRQ